MRRFICCVSDGDEDEGWMEGGRGGGDGEGGGDGDGGEWW